MDKKTAYNFGRDAGLNGANTTNSNFRIFADTELMKAWVKGRNDALSENDEVEDE